MLNTRSNLIKILLILFAFIFLCFNFLKNLEQQFTYLSLSFLQGKLYFVDTLRVWTDTTSYSGQHFWPLGPFPAVTLMPIVLITKIFGVISYSQNVLHIIIAAGSFILCYKIARYLKYSKENSLYWGYAFCFSSMYLGILLTPSSWYLAQNISVLVMFLLIFEYLNKKRLLVLGIYAGILLATRITAGLAAILFISQAIVFLFPEHKFNAKIANLATFFWFPTLFLVFLLFYNYLRFNNFLDFGYANQITLNDALARAKNYGLYKFCHIPGNIYYSLLSTPLPIFRDNVSHVLTPPFFKANPWGMSIFVTSPYLFYLFGLKFKDKISKILLITIFAITFLIWTYYGIGYWQLGYRYFLDFMPLLFLLFMMNYKKSFNELTAGLKALIIISSFINLYFFLTLFL